MRSHLLHIQGMHCHSCVQLLERLPELDTNTESAVVNFGQSTLKIYVRDENNFENTLQKIKQLGFSPTPLKRFESRQEIFKKENRYFLARIAVAGACAGNIMMFTVPIYGGATDSWLTLFNWMSFILFLPILLYSASPFYKGALAAFRYRNLNIDLPITLALLSGFFLSTYNLIAGTGKTYFDSTASFIFLILSSRFFLKKIQQNFLITNTFLEFVPDQKILKWNEQIRSFQNVNQDQLKINDLISLQRNQVLPVDGSLESAEAIFDLTLLSGESLPKTFQRTMDISAGAKLSQTSALIRVKSQAQDSRFAKMLKTLDDLSSQKSEFISITDKAAQWLMLAVFSISILFFIYYSRFSSSEAIDRSLALLILACPCALALGTPLAYGLAMRRARKKGIIIKSPDVFDNILRSSKLFLDKTGTLTYGTLSLVCTEPKIMDTELQKIILKLELKSQHPIAFALRKSWKLDADEIILTNIQEEFGQGISGYFKNDFYEIKKEESAYDDYLCTHVFKNGQKISTLFFSDLLRNDSLKTIQHLKKKFEVFLISGDQQKLVEKVGIQSAIPLENCFGNLSPEQKLQMVSKSENSVMVGDGFNDALALQKASVGIAVQGSIDTSLEHSNCYFLKGGVSQIIELFNISKKCRQAIITNLTISLVYNLIGGILALTGQINPLMAAILMPISSAIIILNTLRSFR